MNQEEVQNGIEIAEKCIGKNSVRLVKDVLHLNYRDVEHQSQAITNAGYKIKSIRGNMDFKEKQQFFEERMEKIKQDLSEADQKLANANAELVNLISLGYSLDGLLEEIGSHIDKSLEEEDTAYYQILDLPGLDDE